VASPKAHRALPDVSDLCRERHRLEGDSWLAIMGPGRHPCDVAAKLNREIAGMLREPETQERLAKNRLEVVASSQEALTRCCSATCPSGAKAVKDSGAGRRLADRPQPLGSG